MFYENKLRPYRVLDIYRTRLFIDRCIFLEESFNIMTIHGRSCEPHPINNITGQTISILDNGYDYPHYTTLMMLRYILKFKINTTTTRGNSEFGVAVGDYDVNYCPMMNIMQVESLFPVDGPHDNIWIADFSMKRSATYFIDLFDIQLWIAFIVVFGIIGFVLAVGNKVLRRFSTNNFESMNFYAIITGQGANEQSASMSRKLLLISLSILVIIFHGAFEAFLSSFLAIRKPDLSFNNLNGLLAANDFTICVGKKTTADLYITKALGVQQTVKRVNNKNCPAVFDDVNRLPKTMFDKRDYICPKGKTALITFNPHVLINEGDKKCDIVPLDGKYFKQYAPMLIKPGFKYRDQMNMGIITIKNTGHVYYVSKKYADIVGAQKDMERSRPVFKENEPIDLTQVMFVLMIPIVGIIMSSFILVIEMLTNYIITLHSPVSYWQ